MAEQTKITLGYLRKFREGNLQGLQDELEKKRNVFYEKYVDESEVKNGSISLKGIRAGNPELLPVAGDISYLVNSNVNAIYEKLQEFIDELDGIKSRLQRFEVEFGKTEEDSVLTAEQLNWVMSSSGSSGSSSDSLGSSDSTSDSTSDEDDT
ncbi:hypothetical protein ACFOVU_09190 [Nocardiopsis sediminis]|uniref:Uncharacterized protein n=1 Tax=Nocardiopsis sediminis TaxID=1778267 RepID=A0ABV8FMJ0_9ACTN